MGRTYFDYADLAFDLEFDVGVLVCHGGLALSMCVLRDARRLRRVRCGVSQRVLVTVSDASDVC